MNVRIILCVSAVLAVLSSCSGKKEQGGSEIIVKAEWATRYGGAERTAAFKSWLNY